MHLHGRSAHAAGSAQDQHRLPRLHPCPHRQRHMGRPERYRQPCMPHAIKSLATVSCDLQCQVWE